MIRRDKLILLASSEDTSVEILTCLAEQVDWYIRYKVACNPNTPLEVLFKLSKDYDAEVSQKAKEELTRRNK